MNNKEFRYTAVSAAINACNLQQRLQSKLAIGVMALGLALSVANPAKAETFTVINTNSSGAGSLLEAVDLANANPGKDTINLSSVTGDILLNDALRVSEVVDINGPGRDQLSINIVPSISNTLFVFLPRTNEGSSMSGLTLDGVVETARSPNATLTLKDVTVGGVYADYSTIEIADSLIANAAIGLKADSGIIKGSNLKIINNARSIYTKGNFYSGASSVSCDDCLIEGNGSAFTGYVTDLTLTNSTIINNSGGIASSGRIHIDHSEFTGNQGGIFTSGRLYITDSVISNNFAGVGAFDAAAMHIKNTTISGNVRHGIAFDGREGTIINSTITGNTLGGISNNKYVDGTYGDITTPDLLVRNSIVAGNNALGENDIIGDTPIKIDHSLIQAVGTTVFDDVIPGSNLINVDPLLGALADNGGPTQIHALFAGSPAINTGDNASCLATDQRGITRPQGSACDMGAYESDSVIQPPPALCDLPPVSVGGSCVNEVVIRSIADIDAYVASNFGKTLDANSKPVYKNLRLLGDLGEPGMAFAAISPCAITVNANASITGADVILHARQGLNVNWSADIDATGEACLVSDKKHALLNGGNLVTANTLAIRGAKKAIVGFQSGLAVNGEAELISTGSGDNSLAKIGNKTVVTAESFTMKADNIAELAFKADVSTANELIIKSGSLTTSETLLANRSNVSAGSYLILQSGGKTRIGFHSTVSAKRHLDVAAATPGDCLIDIDIRSLFIDTRAIYNSPLTGNCASQFYLEEPEFKVTINDLPADKPGPTVATGEALTWNLSLTSSGSNLRKVVVRGRQKLPTLGEWETLCTIDKIRPHDTGSCTVTSTALSGTYKQLIVVSGEDQNRQPIEIPDQAYFYYGQ